MVTLPDPFPAGRQAWIRAIVLSVTAAVVWLRVHAFSSAASPPWSSLSLLIRNRL